MSSPPSVASTQAGTGRPPPPPSWRWVAALPLATLAGLVQALALATPWNGAPLWWLQLLGLALLAKLLLHAGTPTRAALLGWYAATVWLCGSFWWLFISMHVYGGLAAPLAALGVLGLAIFLASYTALGFACFWALMPASQAFKALFFAAIWLLTELARGVLWTGFPWGASGYAHVDGPLAVLARSIGVYGIGFVAAALAMLLAQWRWQWLHLKHSGATLLLLALTWGGLAYQRHCALQGCTLGGPAIHADTAQIPALSLALLQGNIPQDEKFQPGSGVPLALEWYASQLRHAQADLVIAPETAIPLLPQQLEPGYLEAITARYTQAESEQALLLGLPLGDSGRGYTNSALGFTPQHRQGYRYDKHHLVPFGEFIPPLFRWFTELMHIPLGDFNRGTLAAPSLPWKGQRLAPNICYEDLFGEELATRFLDPAQAPTVLINLSNIGWFGDSVAIDQHLQISRMRTLELERPMVRATNTGATAVIDHRGQVTHRLPSHQRAVLHAEVQGRASPPTPYAWWAARWGLGPLWCLGWTLVLLTLGLHLRQRSRHQAKRPPLHAK